MYDFYGDLSAWITHLLEPAASSSTGVFSVFILGLIAAAAPCQLFANIAGITYFGGKRAKETFSIWEVIGYTLGRVSVYLALAFLIWMFGNSLSDRLISFFVLIRKGLGPLMLVMGLYMWGLVRLPGNVGFRLSSRLQDWSAKQSGPAASFFLGVAFSLGFCPTMFWIFFGLVLPMSIQSSAGLGLPALFAVSTTLPVLMLLPLLQLGNKKGVVKAVKGWGLRIQRVSGLLLVLLGVNDISIYWR